MIEILHLQIVQDVSEFMDQHRFLCHRAGCGPAGFRLSPFPLTQECFDVKLSISALYRGSSSISQATPSSVRNFIEYNSLQCNTMVHKFSFQF